MNNPDTLSKDSAVKNKIFFILLIAVFICKGIFYAIYVTPPTLVKTPDDVGHFSYIQYIVSEKQLPILNQTPLEAKSLAAYSAPIGNFDIDLFNADQNASEVDFNVSHINWIAQHPPLYYLLLTPVYMLTSLFSTNIPILIIALRLFTLLFGVVTLLYIKKISELMAIDSIVFWIMSILFVYFAPIQFYFSSITNDALLICLSAVALYYLLRFCKLGEDKSFYLLVLLCALIMYTKYTGGLVVLAYILISLHSSLHARGVKNTLPLMMKGGILGIVLLAPLLAFNLYHYGSLLTIYDDNTPIYDFSVYEFVAHKGYLQEIFSNIIVLVGQTPLILASEINKISSVLFLLIVSSIYRKNYFPEEIKNLISEYGGYLIFVVLYALNSELLLSATGAFLFVIIVQSTVGIAIPTETKTINRYMWFILFVVFGLFFVQHYKIALHRGGPGATHGRYYYIAIVPFLWCVTNGLHALSNKGRVWATLGIFALMIANELEVVSRCLEAWIW